MAGPLALDVRITFYTQPEGIVYQDFRLRCPWHRCGWEWSICHHDSGAGVTKILQAFLEHARDTHRDRV